MILTRLPDDILTKQFLLKLANQADMVAMFPTLSAIAEKMLLLPVGTASVERFFSDKQDLIIQTMPSDS